MDEKQFEDLVKAKIDHILSEIKKQKEQNKGSLLYNFFTPERLYPRYDEFKNKIIALLKQEQYDVTDLLPGNEYVTGGEMRTMYISWTDEGKAEVSGIPHYVFQ